MTNALKLNTSLAMFPLSIEREEHVLQPRTFDALENECNLNRQQAGLAKKEFDKADTPSHHQTLIVPYLLSRGVALPPDCASVRYRKAWCFASGKTTIAMMALISDPITLEALGLHLTYLSPNGQKWGCGFMKDGTKKNVWIVTYPRDRKGWKGRDEYYLAQRHGVIMLSPNEAVKASGVLGIGEGIETTLSLRRLSGLENLRVWAAGDSGGLARFEPPPYVKRLIIAVDNDAAGIKAANELIARCQKLGVQTTPMMHPERSKDLNDYITELKEQGA